MRTTVEQRRRLETTDALTVSDQHDDHVTQTDPAPVPATLSAQDASAQPWPVVIVGAGPTGAVAARELSRAGVRVLLVDRQHFPREKVCGCCLSGRAVGVLDELGLLPELEAAGALPLNQFALRTPGRSVTIPLPDGIAFSRWRFDPLLIRAAIGSGAEFLPGHEAKLLPTEGENDGDVGYRLELTSGSDSVTVDAHMLLVCEGLSQRLLSRADGFTRNVRSGSWIGAGTTAAPEGISVPVREVVDDATIGMAVGRSGYVGSVLLEDGSLNLAAALDPRRLGDVDLDDDAAPDRKAGRLGRLVARVFEESGQAAPEGLTELPWQGTGKLTRTITPVARGRLLILGDAAGYVEPFTGEGMGWGLHSATLCVDVVTRALSDPEYDAAAEWKRIQARDIARWQVWCRRIASLLKKPRLIKVASLMLSRYPRAAGPVLKRLGGG